MDSHILQQEPPLLQLQKKNPTPEISAQPSKAIEQLIDLMEKGEKYKPLFLSHLDLATELSITEGHLSQLANKELNKSITQFINEYRISEAKKLLCDKTFDKFSIEAIDLEAGFKSRSTFYNTFK